MHLLMMSLKLLRVT